MNQIARVNDYASSRDTMRRPKTRAISCASISVVHLCCNPDLRDSHQDSIPNARRGARARSAPGDDVPALKVAVDAHHTSSSRHRCTGQPSQQASAPAGSVKSPRLGEQAAWLHDLPSVTAVLVPRSHCGLENMSHRGCPWQDLAIVSACCRDTHHHDRVRRAHQAPVRRARAAAPVHRPRRLAKRAKMGEGACRGNGDTRWAGSASPAATRFQLIVFAPSRSTSAGDVTNPHP